MMRGRAQATPFSLGSERPPSVLAGVWDASEAPTKPRARGVTRTMTVERGLWYGRPTASQAGELLGRCSSSPPRGLSLVLLGPWLRVGIGNWEKGFPDEERTTVLGDRCRF